MSAAIPAAVRERVREVLGEIEREEGVRVLLAVESGSRAWGFPSPDSDFDVRFIYLHSEDWYLSIQNRRDVIERPPEKAGLDVSGWDLRKALGLFLKSNPPLYEWLTSPLVYRSHGPCAERLRALAEAHYARRTLGWHYLSIARGQLQAISKDPDEVPLKRYFYVIRPLCALLWLRDCEGLPPMSLTQLMAQLSLPPEMREATATLLERKAVTSEMGRGPRLAALDDWIAQVMDEVAPICENLPADKPLVEDLDRFFREMLGDWAPLTRP